MKKVISLHLVIIFPVITAQLECSHCPLVEMESTTYPPIFFNSSYNSTTGVFSVFPCGDGVFYFSTFLLVEPSEAALFDVMLNNEQICSAFGDHLTSGDHDPAVLSSMLLLVMCMFNEITGITWFLVNSFKYCEMLYQKVLCVIADCKGA